MKILMLSIFAPHFFNWTEQLKDSGHEVYWLDIFDSNTRVEQIDFAEQIIGWRYKWNYPGRYFIKKNAPALTRIINIFNERDLVKIFKEKLEEIQPDVVHSFVMSQAVFPIYEIMVAKPNINWIYSSWGSDLYFYEDKGIAGKCIKRVLTRLDFMFSDCKRDYEIAKRNGFNGKFLGVFPGGGGFDFTKTDKWMKPFSERNIILIKGYQGKHGRCIEVLKAIQKNQISLSEKTIVIFGAHPEVFDFVSKKDLWFKDDLEIFNKIPHSEVIKLMGKSLIYIGNSVSDGMPNTLLEAIIMGVFPVQSNPGGASEELIKQGENGLLISEPEDVNSLEESISMLFGENLNIKKGINYNLEVIKPNLERAALRQKVLEKYKSIEK
jgi:glycosyltransferase involved in cell wall biosynthesis